MTDRKTVVLAYRRVPGDLSSGSILLTNGLETQEVLQTFEGLDFKVMMREFACSLIAHPDAGGAIQRTDRPGLMQIDLHPDELELFRTDPVTAIRRRTIPPQTVMIGVDKARGSNGTSVVTHDENGPVLEAGFSSLAQYFGDVVFARARKSDDVDQVECHCCGTWSSVRRINNDRLEYTCTDCGICIPLVDFAPESGWAGVEVKELLGTGREVFFLPRRWNRNGNWITRSELEKLYEEYTKEKTS